MKQVKTSTKPAPVVKKESGNGSSIGSQTPGVRKVSSFKKGPSGQEKSTVPAKKADMGVGKK